MPKCYNDLVAIGSERRGLYLGFTRSGQPAYFLLGLQIPHDDLPRMRRGGAAAVARAAEHAQRLVGRRHVDEAVLFVEGGVPTCEKAPGPDFISNQRATL